MNRFELLIALVIAIAVVGYFLIPSGKERRADLEQLLVKVDAASEALRSASYKAEYRGAPKNDLLAEAHVMLSKPRDSTYPMFRVEGRVEMVDPPGWQNYVAGCDGEQFYIVDHPHKTVWVGDDEDALWSVGRKLKRLVLDEFLTNDPFKQEIHAKKLRARDDVRVGSEECVSMQVVYSEVDDDSIFAFSKSDFLPRKRRIRAIKRGVVQGWVEFVITDFEKDPVFSYDAFDFVVPEGYERKEYVEPAE